jgi:hypothetical protein
VDSGCDLDRLALSFSSPDLQDTPLSIYVHRSKPEDESPFDRSLTCRSHLLKAGADPTLATVDTVDDSDDPMSSSTIIEALYRTDGGRFPTVSS